MLCVRSTLNIRFKKIRLILLNLVFVFCWFGFLVYSCLDYGGDNRARTDDLMLAKHALSQLSYTPSGFSFVVCVVFIVCDFVFLVWVGLFV